MGYNFCAISCESCKAFFRRNATKLEEYKCPFEDKCKVNVVTRKFCRKCRLRKCYAVGMKQEWILNDEEKELRRLQIEENRKWRETNDHKNDTKTSDLSTTGIPSPADTADTNTTISLLDAFDSTDITDDETIAANILHIECYISDTNCSNTSSTKITAITAKDQISDETYDKVVEMELSVLPIPQVPVNDISSLNEVEWGRLTELFQLTADLHRPRPETRLVARDGRQVAQFFATKFESFVGRFVNVMKRLSAFQTICENDQIALIKYSSIEALLMRTALYFDYDQ
ncbi:unnamed protein product, partial [Medioppia subpectinata]